MSTPAERLRRPVEQPRPCLDFLYDEMAGASGSVTLHFREGVIQRDKVEYRKFGEMPDGSNT